MCLCKTCDYTDITTWSDTAKYESVRMCLCCGGMRFIHYNIPSCPNYRGRGRGFTSMYLNTSIIGTDSGR